MIKKSIFAFSMLVWVSNMEALEFGGLGNVSAGMGGAGVALNSSPYALYYNPALLSADNKTKFGYSLGIQYRQKNIDKFVELKLDGIGSSVQDMQTLQNVLKDNNLSIISQNGIVFQLSSSVIREEFGSIALGLFSSLYASVSFAANPDKMAMIIQNGADYFEYVSNGSGGYTQQKTTQQNYEDHSIVYALKQGNAHKIVTSTFILSEIPIGYAKTFYFKNSNLNLGISAKYMNGINATQDIFLNDGLNTRNEVAKLTANSTYESYSTFGIDLGAMYEIDLPKFRYLTFGIVAKNINYPTFKYTSENIKIKPQYRVGVAYNERYFTFAFDADILPNELLNFSYEKQQSQMIGGGMKFDLKYIDLRVGVMGDILQDEGVIFTGGINILGLFDIAIQSGTKIGEASGYKIPKYLSLKIGGSFSF